MRLPSSKIAELMTHQYGNYVIQRTLEETARRRKDVCERLIKKIEDVVRKKGKNSSFASIKEGKLLLF